MRLHDRQKWYGHVKKWYGTKSFCKYPCRVRNSKSITKITGNVYFLTGSCRVNGPIIYVSECRSTVCSTSLRALIETKEGSDLLKMFRRGYWFFIEKPLIVSLSIVHTVGNYICFTSGHVNPRRLYQYSHYECTFAYLLFSNTLPSGQVFCNKA